MPSIQTSKDYMIQFGILTDDSFPDLTLTDERDGGLSFPGGSFNLPNNIIKDSFEAQSFLGGSENIILESIEVYKINKK